MGLEITTESPDIHVSSIIHLLRTKINFIHEDGIITTHETLLNEIIHLVTQEGSVSLLDLSRLLGYKTDISFIVTNKITESKLTLIGGKLFSGGHMLKIQNQLFSDIKEKGFLDMFQYSEKIDIPFELLSNVMKLSTFNIESHLAYTSAYFSNILLSLIDRLNSLNEPMQISIMMGELEIHSCLWEKIVQHCKSHDKLKGKIMSDSLYQPKSYIDSQLASVLIKFNQNGWIQIHDLKKLDIPINYISLNYNDSIILDTIILIDWKYLELVSIIDDGLSNGTFIDLALIESAFLKEDIKTLIQIIIISEKLSDYILLDNLFISVSFVASVLKRLKFDIDLRIIQASSDKNLVISKKSLIEIIATDNPKLDVRYQTMLFDMLDPKLRIYESEAKVIAGNGTSAQINLKSWNDVSNSLSELYNTHLLIVKGFNIFSNELAIDLKEYACSSSCSKFIALISLHIHITSGTPLDILKVNNEIINLSGFEAIKTRLNSKKFDIFQNLSKSLKELNFMDFDIYCQNYIKSCKYLQEINEKDIIIKQEILLLSKLDQVKSDPALALHLSLMIAVIREFGTLLDISGRIIRKILNEIITANRNVFVFKSFLQFYAEISKGIKMKNINNEKVVENIKKLIIQ